MGEEGERDEHLFVVRVWREPSMAGHSDWRGSVEHIGSGVRRYFADLDDVRAFIAAEVRHPQA